MSKTLLESALRILLHARNRKDPTTRVQTRALIAHTIKEIRK